MRPSKSQIKAKTHSICVFCGSSPGSDARYMELARQTGQVIAAHNHRLVYGGGGLGLMGASAMAAHEAGGDVFGIIPGFLLDVEKPPEGIPYDVVDDMHVRKMQMYDESHAFIVLPGGIGTLEECIEVLSWARLHLHDKPIVFVDSEGYWDTLISLIEHIISESFAPDWLRDVVFTANSPEDAVEIIRACWTTRSQYAVKADDAGV